MDMPTAWLAMALCSQHSVKNDQETLVNITEANYAAHVNIWNVSHLSVLTIMQLLPTCAAI